MSTPGIPSRDRSLPSQQDEIIAGAITTALNEELLPTWQDIKTQQIITSFGKALLTTHEKYRWVDQAQVWRFISIATAATAVVLTYLGIRSFSNHNSFKGGTFFMLNIPLSYLSYNSYAAGRNFQLIADNLKDYFLLGEGYDRSVLQARLLKGTFQFEKAVNFIVRSLSNRPLQFREDDSLQDQPTTES